MPFKKITAFALAGVLTASLAFVAVAQELTVDPAITGMSPEQMIDMRQDLMKSNGGTLKAAGALTGAEAVTAAETLIANFSNLTALFPVGTETGDTKALPAIWADYDTFIGIFEKDVEAATAMKAAAEAGDAAAYGEAIKTIGASCGACHQTYRAS